MKHTANNPIESAAARVRRHLADAAGSDGSLSQQELRAKLEELAPTERGAIDGFCSAVKNKLGATGQISMDAIDQAIAAARDELQAGRPGADTLTKDQLAQLSRAGASMVGLARKLRGHKGAQLPPIPREKFAGLEGDALKQAIRDHSARHVELGYFEARQVMFSDIDNRGGEVRGVYTGRAVETDGIPDHSGPAGMNTEHTRPKSRGVRDTAAVSDLHHLFPTDSKTNARRSSFPFGEVEQVKWSNKGSKLGLDKNGQMVFEPPDDHKGNVARSQFYVSSVYGLDIPAAEEAALKSWNRLDPVDSAERQRNAAISAYQENRNPFVDAPELADKVDDF